MLNGGAAPSNENGVTHTNGNGEPAGNHPKALSPVKDLNGVEGLVHKSSEPSTEPASPRKATPSPKKPVQAKQNGASGPSTASEPHREIVEAPQPKNDEVTVRTEEEHAVIDGESEGEADNGHESSGSSLDVVIDDSSSAGSAAGLDLHVSIGDDFVSPDQTLDNVPVIPGPSHRESTPKDEEPYMPDIIKRLKSGGQISSRPTLGDRRKRGADRDTSSGSGHKRHRSEGSSPSLPTSWQFFSPPSALMRVWNRQGEANARHVDDSMVVNVSTVDPPKQEKWCSIM